MNICSYLLQVEAKTCSIQLAHFLPCYLTVALVSHIHQLSLCVHHCNVVVIPQRHLFFQRRQ